MPSDGEITRQFKAKLRATLPDHKFSVTRGGSHISWTDDGPSLIEVEDALAATGLVEDDRNWHNGRVLRLPSYRGSVYFDRYNVAERAAEQQEAARCREALTFI